MIGLGLTRARARVAMLTAVPIVGLFLSSTAVGAATAAPVNDCNTPNGSGGTGIMLTPADTNGSGQQYLTKTGNGTDSSVGGYDFTVTSLRPAGTTFTEFTDCAYSVINGNPQSPGYNENTNNPPFTFNASCGCWVDHFAEGVGNVKGQPDSICDRVQIKGTDGSTGLPFTDYSNVVESTPSSEMSFPGSALTCAPATNTPDVPATALVVLVGAVAIGGFLFLRRRRSSPVSE